MKKVLLLVLISFFTVNLIKAQTTPVPMSSQPGLTYTEAFGDIASTSIWPNDFLTGTAGTPGTFPARKWQSVAVNATGTFGDGIRITNSTAAFVSTGSTGGLQRGATNLYFQVTGASDNSFSLAVDFFMDFTSVNAGTLSFNAAQFTNGSGSRGARLKVFWSNDGTTWTEFTGGAVTAGTLPYDITNAVASTNAVTVTLPAAFNNSATARVRFYDYNGFAGGGSPSGNRPKLSIDNVTVTATAAGVAPTVTTDAVPSAIGTITATLGGNVTVDGTPAMVSGTARGVVWSATATNAIPALSGTGVTAVSTTGTTGTFSVSATSLPVNTQISYRAYGTNSFGTGYGGASGTTFYTYANTPSTPVLAALSSTTASVTIGGGDGNPAATTYAIQETTSGNYVQSDGSLGGTAVWQTASTWGTKTVTGLTTATVYTFKVKARNGAGTPVETAFSGTASIETLAIVPAAPTVNGATTSSLDITVVPNGNGAAIQFAIQETTSSNYVQADGSLSATAVWQTASVWGTKTVTSLSASTTYTFRVKARNAAVVETAFGSTASKSTLAYTPTAPTVNNPGAATLDVAINVNGNPASTQFSIHETTTNQYVQANGSLGASAVWQNIATWGSPKTVTGLTSGATYTFEVNARNGDNVETGAGASASGTTTSSTVPVVTVTNAVAVYTETTGDGGGTVFSDGGAALDDRGLIYNTSSPAETGGILVSEGGTTVSAFTKQITGLTQNTLYYVKAYAHNSVGYGYGPEQSFTTLKTEPNTNGTLTFNTISSTSMNVDFAGGDGDKHLVIALAGSAPSFTPTDITSYTGANINYGSAPALGTGKLVFNGAGTNFTLSGLAANTTYHFLVLAYSENSALVANYYTTGVTGSKLTLTNAPNATPATVPTELTFEANWDIVPGATGYRLDVATDAGFTSFVSGFNDLNVGNVLTYSVNIGLSPATTYYYRVRAVNGTGSSASSNTITTSTLTAEPSVQTTVVNFTTVGVTGMTINFTPGDGSNRIVLVKAGSAVSSNPVDGTSYTATTTFSTGGASQIGTGNWVVYNGTGNFVAITGLAASTTYYVAVYEFNGSVGTENYLITSPALGSQATSLPNYQSKTSGIWSDYNSWQVDLGAGFVDAISGQIPSSTDGTITILNTHIITVNSGTVSADQVTINSGGQITIASGATFVIANGTGTDLIVNGYLLNSGTLSTTGATVSISGASATYDHNQSNVTIPGNISWVSSSTLKLSGSYTGAGTNQLSAGSYQNILWTGTVTSSSDYVSIGDLAVIIALKLTASGSGAGALLTSAPGASPTVTEFEQTSGIVFINRNSGSTRSLTVTGNATVSGGILHIKTSAGAGAGQLIVGGNLNVGANGTLTNSGSAGSAALQFNGSSAQTWSHAGVFSNAIGVSTVTNAGGVTLNTNLALPSTSSLTLTAANFTIASGSTLTIGTSATAVIGIGRTLAVDGILVRTANTTFTTTGTLSISNGGRYQHAHNAGTVPTANWNTGSVCEFTGITATQPGAGLGQTFHHLYWNCATQSSTVNLASGLTTVNGNFEVQNTNSNILRLSSSTLTLNIGGDLIISGTSATLQAASSGNTATINVSGNVNIGSTAILATAGNAWSVNVGGNWTNSGIFTNANSTISFDGIVTQTINKTGGETFRILTINKSAGTALIANNVTVATTLALTSGNLSINGQTLTINGAVSGFGTLTGSSSSNLTINGTAGTILFTSGGTNNYLKDLSLGASGTLTLGNELNITAGSTPGTVTVANGGVLTTGGNLTLKSDNDGTARVAINTSNSTYISGDVTVERYIPANNNRAWRLLGVPTKGGQTIHQAWQENQSAGDLSLSGKGTQIASNSATWAADGFDFQTPGNTLLNYNAATDTWLGNYGKGSATSNTIESKEGYMLYIRGDRTIVPGPGAITPTTLRSKGTLYQGTDAGTTVGANQYRPLANLYPSTIDFRLLSKTGDIDSVFYVWDPKLVGSYGLGGYQTLTWNGGIGRYTINPGGGSYGVTGSNMDSIQSGQGFFVHSTTSGGSIIFNEHAKIAGSRASLFNTNGPVERFITKMFAVNGANNDLADATLTYYDASNTNAVNGNDAKKLMNFGENIGMLRDGYNLATELRELIAGGDTIYLNMSGLKQQGYQFELIADHLDHPNLLGKLVDNYLVTNTPLNLNGTTAYNFTVNADPASSAANRFTVIFYKAGPLPVTFTSIKAQQQNNDIAVEWKVDNQTNIRQYEVERSTDGRIFTKVATQVATGANGSSATYNWLDVNAQSGDNFYRVRSIGIGGDVQYTRIVKVHIGKGVPSITVYPNPVTERVITLQFTDMAKGTYMVNLVNPVGQTVQSKQVNHNGANAGQTLTIDKRIAKGNYQLQIVKPGGEKEVIKLVIVE